MVIPETCYAVNLNSFETELPDWNLHTIIYEHKGCFVSSSSSKKVPLSYLVFGISVGERGHFKLDRFEDR